MCGSQVISLSQAEADGTSKGTGEEKVASSKAAKSLLKEIEQLKGRVDESRARYSQVRF